MNVILVAVAAFIGGIVTALLGWIETQEPFNPKKFMSSVIRSIVGGIGIAVAFNYTGFAVPIAYLIAFLSGAGVDAGLKRVAGAIAARKTNGG